MRQLATGEPVWDLQFDENGRQASPAQGDVVAEVAAAGVTDLFVFSHGWNTPQHSARELYDLMFPMIRDAARGLAGLGTTGFAGIYWPSLWFPPTQATVPPAPGDQQAGGGAVEDLSAGTAELSGAAIAEALRRGFANQAQQDALTQIGQLIDEGTVAAASAEPDEAKRQRLRDIDQLVKSLVPRAPEGEFEDSGETALLLTSDPVTDYEATADAFGSTAPAGAQQGIGDWFGKAINGAKDVLRVFSFNTMKNRAGIVGRNGLGPLLRAMHARSPEIRVHLIGHSFGARLVSFALSGVGAPGESPVASLVLLQGAFSHWSFAHAQDNPFGEPGALNTYADRVHGPLVATHTIYDYAVGVWYPRASFLAGEDAEAVVAGRWGGMGADGFQAVSPASDRTMPADGGTNYEFAPRTFYRIDAVKVIKDTHGDDSFSGAHSDIKKIPVAELAVAAAAAHAV